MWLRVVSARKRRRGGVHDGPVPGGMRPGEIRLTVSAGGWIPVWVQLPGLQVAEGRRRPSLLIGGARPHFAGKCSLHEHVQLQGGMGSCCCKAQAL